jgi:hypothetical protein
LGNTQRAADQGSAAEVAAARDAGLLAPINVPRPPVLSAYPDATDRFVPSSSGRAPANVASDAAAAPAAKSPVAGDKSPVPGDSGTAEIDPVTDTGPVDDLPDDESGPDGPKSDGPKADKPSPDKPGSQGPASGKLGSGQLSSDQPSSDESKSEEPSSEKSKPEEPSSEKPSSGGSSPDKPNPGATGLDSGSDTDYVDLGPSFLRDIESTQDIDIPDAIHDGDIEDTVLTKPVTGGDDGRAAADGPSAGQTKVSSRKLRRAAAASSASSPDSATASDDPTGPISAVRPAVEPAVGVGVGERPARPADRLTERPPAHPTERPTERQTTKRRFRWWPIAAVVVVAAIATTAVFLTNRAESNGPGPAQPGASASGGTSASPTGQPSPSPGQPGATEWSLGTPFTNGETTVTILDYVDELSEIGSDGTWTAEQGEFVILEVEVVYTGKEPVYFPPDEQKLQTADGQTYANDITTAYRYQAHTLGQDSLEPNKPQVGYLAFDIPEDQEPTALLFKGDFLSQPVTIPLG